MEKIKKTGRDTNKAINIIFDLAATLAVICLSFGALYEGYHSGNAVRVILYALAVIAFLNVIIRYVQHEWNK